ncbi:von Willebrand factor type A domain-containing protein [Hygrophoropsis aurantiaca]|uniref:von Willebrand factor type A domain-containing protein n=1 Tax=Hygrophoropsis aurantiaca TaxID=72124 RepID=A0ACB7ZXQ5_9AGAM|nr:von Willebrand factor type A domain-containing protein [Hygrophoropsis aurantiaca]
MTSGLYSHLLPPTCIAIVPIHSVPVPPPSLTLKECKINVSIIDAHSRVTLSQQFQNQSNLEAGQVTYTFSTLASAAVCDFEMIRQDGTKIVGIVKEKEQARRELETALAAGHTAALGEEQTKDIFSICIGNVLPQETIAINLSYINTLIDDEFANQVRFTLPRVYMQRYGTAPEGRIFGSVGHEDVPFTMDVSIQQAGRIRSVTCPSGFNLTVNLGRPDHLDASVGPDANFAVVNVRHTNTSAPSKDVIVVITADGLDKPRAVIEHHPVHQTDAIGLTLVPQFKPIESPLGMEYIFLVDRSGSMAGANIDMARTAHIVLLQGLPSKNTTFNIFSFGSGVSSLWPVSQAYDQNSVDTAMSHIKAMEADYGGTEIARALKAVYKSLVKPLARPVSVFLLTDGGAWDEYLGKCARLVRAARTAPVSDIKVSWPGATQAARVGERERSATLGAPVNLFQPDTDHAAADDELGPLSVPVQQAPSVIPSFFPSSRFQIFAIIPRGAASVEQDIKITGFVRAANVPVEIVVPLQNLIYSPQTAFIHTSAAKALLTELEDKITPETNRASIVRLGTVYGLSSRFTSFIAVDDTQRLPIGVENSSQAQGPVSRVPVFAQQCLTDPLSAQSAKFQRISEPKSVASSALPPPITSAKGMPAGPNVVDAVDKTPDKKEAVLVTLAHLQRFDGSFASNSASVVQLLEKLGGDGARGVFEKHGIAGEVASVLLAWAWMSLCCDVEAEGMKEKADLWLHGSTEGFDVDAVQRELLSVVVFRPL